MLNRDQFEIKGDETVREMTTKMLAKEFLNVPESAYDLRAYALESILPSLSLALENLSVEVTKRGIENDLAVGMDMAAPAAEKAEGPAFNPINWLGEIALSIRSI